MAITTIRNIATQIRSIIYKGVPSQDAAITLNQVAALVNRGIAYLAKKNYFENGNVGEINMVNDEFIINFKNVAVTLDTDLNVKYSVIPDMPIGIPNNMGIVYVGPMKQQDKQFIPINNKDSFLHSSLPKAKGKVYFKLEDGRVYYDSCEVIPWTTVLMKLIGSGSADLDRSVNMPKNYELELIDLVLKYVREENAMPQDIANDGIDKA